MCYTNRSREEEARRLRAREEGRKDHEREARPVHHDEKRDKPLTEKVKEMVGAR
ncbi:MAG TPA: hypothetical protein VHH10_15695 [Rubrobacteraceae bacterium]|jgi:hypothetical protein|nr:hypothetical protein [Actinomycetota bacterium]HEX2183725.1 hypothetical protein [Rubrobacteraceae bacterium]